MFYAIIAVLSIILDQWVKYWTADNIAYGGEARELIPGVLELMNVHNDGAAFSFLSGANAGGLFIILAVVFAVLVVIGLITNFISGKLARWSAVMVAAGGIGNAIDRALYSYVQDMFHLEFLQDFPVFNVADIYITVFCLLFIICIIFGGKAQPESEDDIDYYEEEFEDVPKVRSGRQSRVDKDAYDEEDRPTRGRRAAAYGEDSSRTPRDRRQAAEKDDYDYSSSNQRRSPKDAGYDYEQTPVSSSTRGRDSSLRGRSSAEFEEAFAPRTASGQSVRNGASTEQSSARGRQSSVDPFTEWDRQNASAGYSRAASDSSYGQEKSVPSVSREIPSVATPSSPVRPATTAATKKKSSDDFSLDDILAEFK